MNCSLEAQQPTDRLDLQQHAKEGERALAEGRYADAEKVYQTLRSSAPARPRCMRASA